MLVRQDTCRRFWPHRDYPRLRETARAIERRLGLTLTAAADGTAARSPSRGEIEKATRQGRKPARVELARAVREAAVASGDAEAFIGALCDAGCVAELRRAPSGDLIGFKVARPGDVSATGQSVFYSGSKLAADLSMPSLLRRWEASAGGSATASPAAARPQVVSARQPPPAAASVSRMRTRSVTRRATSWSRYAGGRERAVISGRRRTCSIALRGRRGRGAGWPSPSSIGLRRMARHLIRQRRVATDDDLGAVVVLAVAVAALVREIAAWQREGGRTYQADAAAGAIDRWSAALSAGGATWVVPAPRARRVLGRDAAVGRLRHEHSTRRLPSAAAPSTRVPAAPA